MGKQRGEGLPPLLISRGDGAHGPVRTGEQAVGAERLQRNFDIRPQVPDGPALPVCFRNKAAEFATHVRAAGKLAEVLPPGREFSRAYVWFCQMVQNKWLIGVKVHKLRRDRQVTGIDQNVVDKISVFEQADSAIEIIAQHVAIVGFILKDVPQTAQLWMGTEIFKLGREVRAAEGCPADYTR